MMRISSCCGADYHEVENVIRLIDSVYKVFGFEYHVELSTVRKTLLARMNYGKKQRCLAEALNEMTWIL